MSSELSWYVAGGVRYDMYRVWPSLPRSKLRRRERCDRRWSKSWSRTVGDGAASGGKLEGLRGGSGALRAFIGARDGPCVVVDACRVVSSRRRRLWESLDYPDWILISFLVRCPGCVSCATAMDAQKSASNAFIKGVSSKSVTSRLSAESHTAGRSHRIGKTKSRSQTTPRKAMILASRTAEAGGCLVRTSRLRSQIQCLGPRAATRSWWWVGCRDSFVCSLEMRSRMTCQWNMPVSVINQGIIQVIIRTVCRVVKEEKAGLLPCFKFWCADSGSASFSPAAGRMQARTSAS